MKKLKIKKYFGFTLVELIIVITILAILSTIAFVSFQNYTTQSRDTNRLTSIKTIEKGLQVYFGVNDKYPTPDSKVDILASGSVIGYQGYVGNNVSNIIKSTKSLDPVDNKFYTYSINKSSTKYQLMILAETQNTISYLPQTFAASRYVKLFGDKLGIITDTNNIPIQETGTGVDVSTTTGSYKAYVSNGTTEITGTGVNLSILNISLGGAQPKSCLEILKSQLGNTDGIYSINPTGTGSFKVYCDMTTDSGGWTMVRGLYKESFPLDDNLSGTGVIGTNSLGFNYSSSWSIYFNNINFTQYNFMWRDKRAWVKYNKSDLNSGWNSVDGSCGQSTYRENSYLDKGNINICKRNIYTEDPRISVRNSHTNPGYQNDIIYGEKETSTGFPASNIHFYANTDTNLDFSSVVFIR